jgi:GNAT superfamily N-acetyltransferase
VNSFTIEKLVVPQSLEASDAGDFREMTVVRNAIEAGVVGSLELAPTAEDLLPRWQNPYLPQHGFVAKLDGRIVGRSVVDLPVEYGSRQSSIAVEVLEEFRERGIGASLYDSAEAAAVAGGRNTLQGEVLTPIASGRTLASPTGFGALAADVPGVRFALARGFELQQVVRASRLALPAELPPAPDRAGYRIVAWQGATPERWLDDMAVLNTRMSTDAPSAGLDTTAEVWDAERVRTQDELRQRGSRLLLLAAAEHVASGRLVAFSELSVPGSAPMAVHQEDTLVLSDHRGHRLGMLVKLANLAALEASCPGHPSVITFNAEENRHMLSVNEDLGFVAFGYEGNWQKRL